MQVGRKGVATAGEAAHIFMPMNYLWLPFGLVLFALIYLCLRAGWIAGRRRLSALGDSANEGVGAAEGAIFAMMGLLLAFTFTGAASRFENRRELIIQESNAIGTAWLRLDLLDATPREQARELMRRYLDERLHVYQVIDDADAVRKSLADAAMLQSQIWNLATEQWRADRSRPIPHSLYPALNDMFDIASTRVLATRQHPPPAIFVMLGALVLVSAFMVGFGQAKSGHQSPLHLVGFAATTALALYLIFDLEYPRLGLIRVDNFDRALVELRATMN